MMYPVIQSPCVFEPLPSLNMFGFEQPMMAPVPKRRRGLGRSSGSCTRFMPSKAATTLSYTVDESPEGYTLSLWKQVPKGMVAAAVEGEIAKLKEESYRPSYHLVRDLWGNSYFLEEEADEEELLRDALSKLNLKNVNRKIARSLFQEYEIDLNNRGDELTVSSRKDGVSKAFEIGCQIDDVKVIGCKLNETQEYGVLQISLVKSDECKGQTNDLARLIQWSQLQGAQEDAESERALKAEAAEAEANAKREAEARARLEAQAKLEAEAAEAEANARREAEARARLQAEAAAKIKAERQLQAEERRRIEQQRLEEEEEEEEEERKQAEAEAKFRRLKAKEEREKEARKLKDQQLKEKKAYLVEQQRAKRLRKEQAKSAPSPKTVTININFGNEDSSMRHSDDDESTSLKKYQSPILEDVDDAEISRFNESLSRSPRESPIVEEI